MLNLKVRDINFYFLCTLSILALYVQLYFVGANYKIAFIAFYIALLVPLTLFITLKDVSLAILFYTIVLVTQPVLTSIITGRLDESTVKVIVSAKEIVLLTVLLVILKDGRYLKNSFKWGWLDKVFIFFVFSYSVAFLHGGASLFAKVLSLREGVFIAIAYFIGRFSIINLDNALRLVKHVSYIAIFVCMFGIGEYFFIPLETWNYLGALDYTKLKRGDSVMYGLSGYVPNQWFSYHFQSYHRRMVSTILDPTSLSRFLVFPLMYFVFIKTKKELLFSSILLSLVTFLCVFLSLGKGGLLVFLIATTVVLFSINKLISILSVLIITATMLFTNILDANEGNLQRHTSHYGVLVTEILTKPLGSGLGMTGQQAVNHGLVSEREGEESYFVSMVRQCGLLGFTSYILLFVYAPIRMIYNGLLKSISFGKARSLELVTLGCFLGVSITSFLANSAVALISSSLIFIFLGIINNGSDSYNAREHKFS